MSVGFRAIPSLAIAKHSADAGFGREPTDMVIMHFDLIRFQHQYHWLQGIGAVRSINVNEEGSAAGMSLEHAMTVEELPVGDEAAQALRDLMDRKSGTPRPLASV